MSGRDAARGFVLVELVVVITILGILAAFAVPRFLALQVDARVAAVEALEGRLRSSATLMHALWLARGRPASVLTDSGAQITIVNGYPDLATIDDTVEELGGFTYDPATGVFLKTGASGNCSVTYIPPARLGAQPTFATPTTAELREECR